MTFHSGLTGALTVGSGTSLAELALKNWNVNPTAEMVKFVNSKTGTYPQREATFKDASIDFTIDYDFDANPFQTPIGIQIGTVLTNVKLYLNGGTAGTSFWLFPKLIVQSTPQSLSIEGELGTRVSALADGTFSYPV